MSQLEAKAERCSAQELHFELVREKVHSVLAGGWGSYQIQIVDVDNNDYEAKRVLKCKETRSGLVMLEVVK